MRISDELTEDREISFLNIGHSEALTKFEKKPKQNNTMIIVKALILI